MDRRTRPRCGSRGAAALAVALVVGSGVAAGAAGSVQAVRSDPKMVVRVDASGTSECYYRPGQLIAPPGMAPTIAAVAGIRPPKEGPSLVPERLRQFIPPSVQRVSLYSLPAGADPFDVATAMAAAGHTSVAPNYIASFAPVRTWAPGGDATPTATPSPVTVGGSGDGKGARIGIFDTGLERKLLSTIPGSGSVSYLPAQSVRAAMSGLGLIEPGYVQPLELSTGRAAGHGTFITGLVRRALPAASIVVSQVPFTGPADASFGVDPAPGFASNTSSRTDDAALTYMLYSAFLPTTGVTNIDVLSLSFGSYGCNRAFASEQGAGDFRTPVGIRSALLTLWERSNRRLMVAAAAGNDGTDEPFYPAAFSAVSCFDPSNVPLGGPPPPCEQKDEAASPWLGGVASTKSTTIGAYSNFGPWADVVADGSDVASLLHTMTWARWSGTSFAAPCAAVFAAEHGGGLSWADVAGRTIDCGLRDRTAP